VGVQALGGQEDEKVVGVGGEGGDQAAGAVDGDVAQGFVARGISEDGEHAGRHGALDALGLVIDHDEGDAGVLQLGCGPAADASESADDEVILELVDHMFVPPLANGFAELQLDDGLGHGADRDEDGGDPEKDEEGIENAAGAGEGMDFAVAHRGHGGEGHVEGIEGRVAVN
jgi:hypothetical protein